MESRDYASHRCQVRQFLKKEMENSLENENYSISVCPSTPHPHSYPHSDHGYPSGAPHEQTGGDRRNPHRHRTPTNPNHKSTTYT